MHLGFSSFSVSNRALGKLGFFGWLEFNATGSKYDVVHVSVVMNPSLPQPVSTKGNSLIINLAVIIVGEVRGFTGTGEAITYEGYPVESCNIDLFAVDLTTGKVRPIISHPEYADPIAVSPDDHGKFFWVHAALFNRCSSPVCSPFPRSLIWYLSAPARPPGTMTTGGSLSFGSSTTAATMTVLWSENQRCWWW